jgi:hypothetical protein
MSSDISTWKVKDLRGWLEENGVDFPKTLKKSELVDLVEAQHGDGEIQMISKPRSIISEEKIEPSKMKV